MSAEAFGGWGGGLDAFLKGSKGTGGSGIPRFRPAEGFTNFVFLVDLEAHDGFQAVPIYKQYRIGGREGTNYNWREGDDFHPDFKPGETKIRNMAAAYVFPLEAYRAVIDPGQVTNAVEQHYADDLKDWEGYTGPMLWEMGPQIMGEIGPHLQMMASNQGMGGPPPTLLHNKFAVRRTGQNKDTRYVVLPQGEVKDLPQEVLQYIGKIKGDLPDLNDYLNKRRYTGQQSDPNTFQGFQRQNFVGQQAASQQQPAPQEQIPASGLSNPFAFGDDNSGFQQAGQ